jgi:hypothetical protein
MKVYCRKCGSGTAYVSQKPKFCSQCGNSFVAPAIASKPAPPRPSQTVIQKPKLQEDSGLGFEVVEKDDSPSFESMSKLDCEIQKTPNRKVSLGEIAGTSEEGAPIIDRPKAYARKRVSKKQVLEDFKNEAGQSRESSEL